MIDKNIERYVEGLKGIMEIKLSGDSIVIKNGTEYLKYQYIDIEDLKIFIISYFYDIKQINIKSNKSTLHVLGIIYGVNQRNMLKKLHNISEKLKRNFIHMGYNV